MGPKKGIKTKVTATKEAAVVPNEDLLTISGNQSDLSDSQNTKRKRDEDDLVSSSLGTPTAKSSSTNSMYMSSARSSTQSSSFSSVTSTSSGNHFLASTNSVKVLTKGRSFTKSHVMFSSNKKHVYLQDSLDLVEEASLELNDEKVYDRYNFLKLFSNYFYYYITLLQVTSLMNAPGYHGLNISFAHSFIVRVQGRQDPLCVNNYVAIFLQLFLFTKASQHSSTNLFRAMQQAHNTKFEIFTKAMFYTLSCNAELKKKISNLSENISRDLKDIFITLGTGRTSWFQKDMNETISRSVLCFSLNFLL